MLINKQYKDLENCQHKKVLIYAPGGGYGHFTRSLAIVHTFKLLKVTILVSSTPLPGLSQNDAIVQQIPIAAQSNKSEFRSWFTNVMLTCKPEILVIDTFPAGITGELNEIDLKGIHTLLIGRDLRWDVYNRNVEWIRNKIDQIYLVETVNEQYLYFLNTQNSPIATIEIEDSIETDRYDPEFVKCISHYTGEKWLIVHSGSRDECEVLYEYAQKIARMHHVNPVLFLCGNFNKQLQDAKSINIEIYPVYHYYSLFDRVITGAGFNSVRQVKKYANTYNFYPFERLYDDQFARIMRSVHGLTAADCSEVKCALN
jgi:hypothetical protein